MRVLLDENIPHQLRGRIPHQVMTVAYMGWASWRNGVLLGAAEDAGFEVLVTGDLSMEYQQNLTGRSIAVVVLSSQNWRVIRGNVGRIVDAIERAVPGPTSRVDCGAFTRRRSEPSGSPHL